MPGRNGGTGAELPFNDRDKRIAYRLEPSVDGPFDVQAPTLTLPRKWGRPC
jgi:hypothetical protein